MRQLLKSAWTLIRNWWRVDRIRVPRSQWRADVAQYPNNEESISRDRREGVIVQEFRAPSGRG